MGKLEVSASGLRRAAQFSALAEAQNIGTKVLTAGTSMRIELSPEIATTLLFPGPISGTFGMGLVGNGQNQQGLVQIEHPDGSAVLVLHALTETAHVVMTVLFDGSLYVFHLESGPSPDAAVTLTKPEQSAEGVRQVSAEEVKASRLKYDPELLVQFERKARDAALLRKLYPDLCQGYASCQAEYTSDSGTVKTTVTQIFFERGCGCAGGDGSERNQSSDSVRWTRDYRASRE